MQRMRAKNSGFTLAELLVATVLLSIVMTSVYTLCNSVLSAWRAVEEDYDAYQDSRIAVTIMQRELNSLLSAADFLFEGSNDEFTTFLVQQPMNVEETEGRHLLRVRYYRDSHKNELIREEALVVKPLPQNPREDELTGGRLRVKSKKDFVIATGVQQFRVRYLWMPLQDSRDGREAPTPQEPIIVERHEKKWHLGMPNAIEVTMRFKDPKRSRREEFVIKTTIPIPTQGSQLTRKELLFRLKEVVS